MTPEAKVKKEIKKLLHKYKIYYIMPRPGIFGAPVGTADFICCLCGYFIAIEAKAANGHERGVQATRRGEVITAGGMGFIVTPDRLPALEQTFKTIIMKSMQAMQEAIKPDEVTVEKDIADQIKENSDIATRALGFK